VFDGIVFDLDGTLADSRLDFAAMRAETGCPQGTGLLEFIDALGSDAERRQAMSVIHYYEMDGAQRATWIDGAESLCHRLRGSGMPLGVFTRNSREAAELMIASLGIPCDALVAREDAAAKPDPEGLFHIARRFSLAPAQMLCVGDFLYDLQAAANAGMPSCLYDPQGDSPHGRHADYVVASFHELAAMLYGDTP
jgi:HAD superfamily hydrolase (TIGR01509 family)